MYGPWQESFTTFLEYVGSCPSKNHSLERINNDMGYFPGNVKWATKKEQSRNRRNNIRITYKGETYCLSEWCERLGLNYKRTWRRINSGWDFERAITEPQARGTNG